MCVGVRTRHNASETKQTNKQKAGFGQKKSARFTEARTVGSCFPFPLLSAFDGEASHIGHHILHYALPVLVSLVNLFEQCLTTKEDPALLRKGPFLR
jgi:hypothetical protein